MIENSLNSKRVGNSNDCLSLECHVTLEDMKRRLDQGNEVYGDDSKQDVTV